MPLTILDNFQEWENFLRNATFLLLFLTTIFYWSYTAFYFPKSTRPAAIPLQGKGSATKNFPIHYRAANFFSKTCLAAQNKILTIWQPDQTKNQDKIQPFNFLESTNVEFNIKTHTWLKSLVNLDLFPGFGTVGFIGVPTVLMFMSNISLILLLLVRWEISGHFPLSNLYESLMFLAWCCTFLFLIYKTSFTIPVEKIVGSLIASSALLLNAFATFSLPKEMQQSASLVPALQSNWLMMHVTVMIISYATLIIGSLLSILFLILNKLKNTNKKTLLPRSAELFPFSSVEDEPPYEDRLAVKQPNTNLLKDELIFSAPKIQRQRLLTQIASNLEVTNNYLDGLSYRIIGLGFPFLTIGILSGAVWANEAWGSYWSWDPKETWALLTWLVFAIYLHTRLTKGWQGEKPAIIASLGFIVVWFCYLGVNLIGEGLHSYGFLT
uniref:Cytochrome c biogenesis protein CcsA n=1 Tax=Volvulina compacta TaxID=51721 RepID=A0A6C0RWS8_9CHLO|nr:heme attachment to plastid cytochrome c [Volvulina compacta]